MESLDLEKAVALDPQTDVQETYKPVEIIQRGGVNKTIYRAQSDAYGNNSISFNNICPPSLDTVVGRFLKLHYFVQVQVTYPAASAAGAYPLFPALQQNGQIFQGGGNNPTRNLSGVLRAFPLQSACAGMELKINGVGTSVSPNVITNIYPHILTDDEKNLLCSEFPVQKDDSALYQRTAGFQDNRSPFTNYEQNTANTSRSSILGTVTSAVAAGVVTDTYLFEVFETLIISPMTFGDGENSAGLCNVNNLTLTITIANPNKMVSVMPAAYVGAGGVNATVAASIAPVGGNVSRAELLLSYITQDPQMAQRTPEEVVFNYELLTSFPSNAANGLTNATGDLPSVPSLAIRLSSIPDKLFIFACPRQASLAANNLSLQTVPDTFLRIKNLQLNWGNTISRFGTHTEMDLWKMSVRNGLKDSWFDWRFGCGSMLIIDPATDGLLEPEQASGQPTYTTMQAYVTLSAANVAYVNNDTATDYDLYVVVSQNGKCIISKSNCVYTTTGATPEQVLAAVSDIDKTKVKVDENATKAESLSGGSVFGGLGRLMNKGLHLASKVEPQHIKTGLELAKKGLEALGVKGGAMHHKKGHRRVY